MLVDLLFVDGEGYLISRTEPGRLKQVDIIYSKKSEELEKVLSRQIRLHKWAGYVITTICCDKEGGVKKALEQTKEEILLQVKLDTERWEKHVPAIFNQA